MHMRFRVPASVFVAVPALWLTSCDSPTPKSGESSSVEKNEGEVVELAEVKIPEVVSFNEHVQPILSEYCYHCHGPDAGTRAPEEAPLRLDLEEDAFALRDNGKPVIIKGDPKESLVVKRMRTYDKDLIMPPPIAHKEMDEQQIAIIERWIEQGAEYEAHWSFNPVESPELPKAGKDWASNPIDHFVAAKLEEAGLKPNAIQ